VKSWVYLGASSTPGSVTSPRPCSKPPFAMAPEKTQEELEIQIKDLHCQLEKLGVNSSGQKDIFGRRRAARRARAKRAPASHRITLFVASTCPSIASTRPRHSR